MFSSEHHEKFLDVDRNGHLSLKRSGDFDILDFHTHLNNSYFLIFQINLERKTAPTKFLMPHSFEKEKSVTKLRYYSYSQNDLRKISFSILESLFETPGTVKTHNIPNLLKDMKTNGITKSIILPIDLPLFSYNTESILKACEWYSEIIPFCSVHPIDPFKSRKLKKYIEMGAKGMKIHPEVQLIPPNHPAMLELLEEYEQYAFPVIFHAGSTGMEPLFIQQFSKLKLFEKPIKSFSKINFVLAHCGLREYEQSFELARKYKNVYLEISGQPAENIKKAIDIGLENQILFGSDWAWYNPVIPIFCALSATEHLSKNRKKIRENIFSKNAKKLLAID